MWLAPIAELLMLATLTPQAVGDAPAAGPKTPEPIVTQQTLFAIPFRIERAQSPDQEPVEVQLYVSGDRGASWQLYSRADPARQQFLFRAGGDGEYWFVVRTLNRAGQLRPEGSAQPELRVVVDTRADAGNVAETDASRAPGGATAAWRADRAGPPSTPWPAERPNTNTVAQYPTAGSPAEASNPSDNRSPQRDIAAGTGPGAGPVAVTPSPPIRNQFTPPQESGALAGASGLPQGERPRMVNSRLFELVYDDQSAAAASSRVELWGTQDGGRTWRSFAISDDSRKPILVKVDDEGIYGFRAVRSGVGAVGKPPKSGDVPEVWIGVDLTKPAGRILSAVEGSGPDAGGLVVSWEAGDKMLAVRPVSLLISETPGGPWSTIAAGLENTGRYCWPVNSRVPQRIYLRLEVRDEAGNLGVFEPSEAVVLEHFHPSVTVPDVRPVGQSANSAPKRYYLR